MEHWISGISVLLVWGERYEYSGYKAILLPDMQFELFSTT